MSERGVALDIMNERGPGIGVDGFLLCVSFNRYQIHICLYCCLYVHGTAETPDGVAELPDTQTTQQTDVNETYS